MLLRARLGCTGACMQGMRLGQLHLKWCRLPFGRSQGHASSQAACSLLLTALKTGLCAKHGQAPHMVAHTLDSKAPGHLPSHTGTVASGMNSRPILLCIKLHVHAPSLGPAQCRGRVGTSSATAGRSPARCTKSSVISILISGMHPRP
jgi:hypothetical protein